ncbi:MAG: hypothetical protein Kow00127_10080 [Bacteroidales bacterium]
MFELKEVIDQADVEQFISFPFELYKSDPNWVPPLKSDERVQLDKEKNPAYREVEARFWIVTENGRCVGRIGAIIHPGYNRKTGKDYGRITRMEFIDHPEVCSMLFDAAEEWIASKGMKWVHGPLGFNNLDNQGLLIEGFEYEPSIASVYHKPYYRKHWEAHGYEKENDWIEFRLTLGEHAVKKASRGASLVCKRYGFEVHHFSSRNELKPLARDVFRILNESFSHLPYVSSFDDVMIDFAVEKYFKALDPRFVKTITKDNRLIAFIVGMPSMTRAMQKARGRLFPFGIYHVYKALKHPQVIDLLLTGVHPEYHSSGAAVVLFAALQEEMMKHGIDQMETTGIFETNHNVISNWKNYQHIQHKRRRCFVKQIA